MHKDFMPPISMEEFAAYLDGNLSASEMKRVAELVSNNSDMEELVSIADSVDDSILSYMEDEFSYESDMNALENSDCDIPNLDAVISTRLVDDIYEYHDNIVANDISEPVETTPSASSEESDLEIFENDRVHLYYNEDPCGTCFEDGKNDSIDTLDFPSSDDFFE